MSASISSSSDSETTPLLQHASERNEMGQSKWLLTSLSSVLLIIMGSLVGYSQLSQPSSSFTSSSVAEKSAAFELSSANDVQIFITNEYSLPGAPHMFPYPFLSTGYLMEPYRESTVTVSGLSTDCGFNWQLTKTADTLTSRVQPSIVGFGVVDNGNGNEDVSTVFTVTADQGTGKHSLMLSQECTNSQYEFTVYVRYVRRDLQTLTDSDREEFLDAMHLLWTTSTEEGRKLYGDRYKSAAYLSQIHLDGQDNGFCDQFHTDAGFFANHMYIQAYLEQSLQLVNPRTCLHYWEISSTYNSEPFTITHLNNQLDGGTYTELMTAKWFGSSDPNTGRIVDGRWKDMKVPFLDDAFFAAEGINKEMNFFPENDAEYKLLNTNMHSASPYGLLRSVWNYNPSPYLARYNNVERIANVSLIQSSVPKSLGVNCALLYLTMEDFANKPLTYVTNALQSSPHTSGHWTPGGSGGPQSAESNRVLRETFGFTDAMIAETSQAMGTARRVDHKYFDGSAVKLFDCTNLPYDFTMGALKFNTPPGEKGSIQCSFFDSLYDTAASVDAVFASIFSTDDSITAAAIAEFTLKEKIDLLHVLEKHFSYPGEMSVSSAVTDPLFWVLHGPFERLFQLLVFKNAMSSLEYDTQSTCAGHDAASPKHWLSGFYLEDESIDVSTLPLRELQNLLNPLSLEFETLQNFVYDSAEWPHCPKLVSTLENAIKDAAASAANSI